MQSGLDGAIMNLSDQDTESGFLFAYNLSSLPTKVGVHPASVKPLVSLVGPGCTPTFVVLGGYMSDVAANKTINPLQWPYSVAEQAIVLHIKVDGQPTSKARRAYENRLRCLMRDMLNGLLPDSANRFGLRCLFYRDTRQRIDCDNLMKAVSDAATGVAWKDDAQVVEVIGRLFLASDKPYAEIVIYRVDDPAPRKRCLTCGKEVITYPSTDSNYCSPECYRKSTYVTTTCKECGKEFELVRSLAKKRAGFCSRRCALLFYGRQKTAERGPQTWKCRVCGGPVSRKEYEVCRGFSMKERSLPTSNYWKVRHAPKHDDKANPRVEVEIRKAVQP